MAHIGWAVKPKMGVGGIKKYLEITSTYLLFQVTNM
jgi:hypothetical protein